MDVDSKLTRLRDFLSGELYEWLTDDALDVDKCPLQASDSHEEAANKPMFALPTESVPSPAPTPSPTPGPGCSRPFAAPKTAEEIELARSKGVPCKTRQDTNYCVRLWNAWSVHHQATAGVLIPPLADLKIDELQHWLTRYVLEVRKKDGSEFPPNTLHHLVCGITRYLWHHGQPELDVWKDPEFSNFRASLYSSGMGAKRRQAEVLTDEEEEMLWQRGLLGDTSPQALLDTMVFTCGLYFALRSGQEHRQLCFLPCQIELCEPTDGRLYLQYVEDC